MDAGKMEVLTAVSVARLAQIQQRLLPMMDEYYPRFLALGDREQFHKYYDCLLDCVSDLDDARSKLNTLAGMFRNAWTDPNQTKL